MSGLVVSKVFLSAQVLRFFLFLPMPFPLQRHSCWPSSTTSWAQILGATVWLLPPRWENHHAIPTKQGRSKPEQLPPRPHQIPFSALTAADWLQHPPNSGGHRPPGRWRDLPRGMDGIRGRTTTGLGHLLEPSTPTIPIKLSEKRTGEKTKHGVL